MTPDTELTPQAPRESEQSWAGVSLVVTCLAFVTFTVWRDAGSYGHVFADERTYSYYARLMPASESPVPSFLYLWLFKATNACGEGWLSCARLLNALLYAGALPLIYAVCRRHASARSAAVIVAATALSPLSSYTAYFMPEATYFFGAWVLIWFISGQWPRGRRFPLVVGVVLGLLVLVKMHAFFLAPAVGLFVLLEGWRQGGPAHRFREAILSLVLLIGAASLVRFGVGWLLAGPKGLHVLGNVYGEQAATGSQSMAKVIAGLWQPLGGHLQALALLFAVPLAAMLTLSRLRSSSPPGARVDGLRRLQGLLLLLLVPPLLTAVLFTAKITGEGTYELAGRLHLRYYNFLFPLLLIVAAAQADHQAPERRRFSPWVLFPALLVGGFGVYAIVEGIRFMLPVITDCPELRGITRERPIFLVCAAVGLGALAAWAFSPRLGSRLYLFVALPVVTLSSACVISGELRELQKPPVCDVAATVTRRFLGPEGVENVQVVIAEPVGGYRALFVLSNQTGSFIERPEGSTVERPAPPKDWLLLIGNYVVTEPHKVMLKGDGYSLVHLEPPAAVAP